MDIMELGAIGELVGGVAVIGSLIYVGLQVRQNNEQARQSCRRNAIERGRANRELTRDFNDMTIVITDAELMQLLRQGMADFDALSRNDQGNSLR